MQAGRGVRKKLGKLLDWNKVNEQDMRVNVPGHIHRADVMQKQEYWFYFKWRGDRSQ